MEPSRNDILKALERVIDPELRRPVTELDMVRDVGIEGNDVSITIALTVAGCPLRSSFEQQVEDVLRDVPGVDLREGRIALVQGRAAVGRPVLDRVSCKVNGRERGRR